MDRASFAGDESILELDKCSSCSALWDTKYHWIGTIKNG
jgi:hypothetical protein